MDTGVQGPYGVAHDIERPRSLGGLGDVDDWDGVDMAESTHTGTTDNSPRYGHCHWHNGQARGVRLIEVIEQGSGPGHGLNACPPCRGLHGLVPLADR